MDGCPWHTWLVAAPELTECAESSLRRIAAGDSGLSMSKDARTSRDKILLETGAMHGTMLPVAMGRPEDIGQV